MAQLPQVNGNIQSAIGRGTFRRATGIAAQVMPGTGGLMSLVALFFSAIKEAQAADPNVTFLDDGSITYKDLEHGAFELVTKEAIPRRILVDDPGQTIVLSPRGSSISVNQVANSAARMGELQAAQQDALANYARGVGASGSSTPAFDGPLPLQRINFIQTEAAPLAQEALPPLPSIINVVPEIIFGRPPPPVVPDINDAPTITSVTDPPAQAVIVNPDVLGRGVNTNSLGLSTEAFDGLPVGSGNFYSATLDATFSASGNVGLINETIPGVGVSVVLGPLPGNLDTTNFLIVSAGGIETITFGSEKNFFGLYWGTVDPFNRISFYDGTTLVASYTGADILPLLNDSQDEFASNRYVEFSGLDPFDNVVLESGTGNAFEVENISAGFVSGLHTGLAGPISGSLNVHDPDFGDTLTASVIGNATIEFTGSDGSTTLPSGADVAALIDAGHIAFDTALSNGGTQTLHWTYNPGNPDLDFLKAGDELSIQFTAQVNDGHGNVANQTLTISIVGARASQNTSLLSVVSGTVADETVGSVGDSVTTFGGGGNDNFVFNAGFGAATIGDSEVSNDRSEISQGLFGSISESLAAATDSGPDTIIIDATTNTITLKGVAAAQLQASDFHLF